MLDPNITQSAKSRGARLYPGKSSRLYWHLTALRQAYELAIRNHIESRELHTLVDYGCGNMPYRTLFPVKTYLGADFPGNEMAELRITDEGLLPLESNTADVILSSQVLEHVADVPRYLAESHRVLNDTGILFLSTHGMWRYHPDPGDYWRWTCDGLKRTVESAGFEILSFQGVMGPEATALQLWQDAVLPRVPRWAKTGFTKYTQWRIQRADHKCPAKARDHDACVYLLVARKKQNGY